MGNIFDAGFSPELDRSDTFLQPKQDTYTDVTTSGVSGSISPTNLSSGAMASILFSGKETFTSTTAGYRMGIDLSDDIYKWIIGGSTSSIDWAVTTADTLTVVGAITATTGSIGGFNIGSDYIRDVANSFGLASTVTGGDDVRFWAGDTFANRAIAPLRIYESGAIVATSGTFTSFRKSTTTVTITNSTTETAILSESIPANTLGTTGIIQGSLWISPCNVTLTTSLITLRLKYGATTLASAIIRVGTNGRGVWVDFVIHANGTTSSQTGDIKYIFGGAFDFTYVAQIGSGTSAEDSTAAKTLVISAQYDAVNGVGDTLTMNHYQVEIR